MLYLTRKTGESVMVGDEVRVTVLEIERKRVTVHLAFEGRRLPGIGTVLLPGKVHMLRDSCAVVLRSTRLGQCSLGFKAPRGVPIHRQEVYDRIAEANDADS